MGLDFADLSFPPDAVHVPGVAHKLADKLSRVFAPVANEGPAITGTIRQDMHPAIATAKCDTAPPRDASYYKC